MAVSGNITVRYNEQSILIQMDGVGTTGGGTLILSALNGKPGQRLLITAYQVRLANIADGENGAVELTVGDFAPIGASVAGVAAAGVSGLDTGLVSLVDQPGGGMLMQDDADIRCQVDLTDVGTGEIVVYGSLVEGATSDTIRIAAGP
jgi:hypothetical protein